MCTQPLLLAEPVQGLGKTCMHCGDGINDLIALGAADVGMAVGSADTSAAATVCNERPSIAVADCAHSVCMTSEQLSLDAAFILVYKAM